MEKNFQKGMEVIMKNKENYYIQRSKIALKVTLVLSDLKLERNQNNHLIKFMKYIMISK
jgi:hypothetical protein